MAKKWTIEMVRKYVHELNQNVDVISDLYENRDTRLTLRCSLDGYEWETNFASIKRHERCNCPLCKGAIKWSEKEINVLKENYPYMTIDELLPLFKGRSKSSISNKAAELKLSKYQEECKEGYCICKKCGRELPWTYQYFPVIRKEKNPRQVCRECSDKYKKFMDEDAEMRIYWSEEDELLFMKRYPHYTNEELRNKFYPDLSDKQLTDKAWRLGVQKSHETYWRGREQQAPKVSLKLKGVAKSEDHKKKVSETKKRQYAEGIYVSHWKGRIVTEEEKQRIRERVKGKWSGKNNPRFKKPLFGSENGRWQGGITSLSTALRENIYEWKQKSMELCNYKCVLTGCEFDNIHHIIPFNIIIKECISELDLEILSTLGEYEEEDRENLIELLKKKHELYGLGICLHKDIHKLFHDTYSYTEFNANDFKEFIVRYFNGEFDDKLKVDLKSINSKRSLEEVKKLASFYYA